MHFNNKRLMFLLIFIMSASATLIALYAQFYQNKIPCPLCIAERIILMTIAICSFLFAIHNPKNILNQLYSIIVAGLGIFGFKITAHHIWLINLPAEQQPSSCGMPLPILYNKLKLTAFIKYILAGDAECTKNIWSIFNINVTTLLIALFTIITLIAIYMTFLKNKHKSGSYYY